MSLIDLTHPLASGVAGYPGDPGARFYVAHDHSEAGYHVTDLHLGSHVGTHIDAPLHVMPHADDVAEVSLTKLVGPARMVELGPVAPRAAIGLSDVGGFRPGERVLLRSGWASRFGTDEYHADFPELGEDLIHAAAEARVALLGIEQPSIRHTRGVELHQVLLSAGVALIEGLQLSALTEEHFLLACLPLRLPGADGSPVRAIAFDLSDLRREQ